MADRSKIVDRIVKLFRLGSDAANTTEAEMQLAASKAKELMAEHDITAAELALAAKTDLRTVEFTIRSHPVYTRRIHDFAKYDHLVASTVAAITSTKPIVTRTREFVQGRFTTVCTMVFVGTEQDTAVAGELFLLLLTGVRAMARRAFGSAKWTQQHTSYAIGVGCRLYDRSREAVTIPVAHATTHALVVRSKEQAMAQYMEQQFPGRSQPTNRRLHVDAVAFSSGYHDGRDVSLDRRGMRGGGA